MHKAEFSDLRLDKDISKDFINAGTENKRSKGTLRVVPKLKSFGSEGVKQNNFLCLLKFLISQRSRLEVELKILNSCSMLINIFRS